jgi:hypothetical protein
MKPLCTILLCITFAPWSGAQTAPAASLKPALDSLPFVTIQFKPVGNALAISPGDAFIGYPFCSSNGTTFLDVGHHPGFVDRSIVGVSPKAELSTYQIGAAPGLVNINVYSVDAAGSDVYALVVAEKADTLRERDLDPASADAKRANRYYQYFILRFGPNLAVPDEIAIDPPFRPMQLAVMGKDAITILGVDRVNQFPVIGVIDHKGQLVREIDSNGSFGSPEQIIAGTLGDRSQDVPESAQLEMALSAGQWVHYGDSLLFLMPGPHARVITLRSGGEVESTRLRLLAGFQARSLIPSDNNWFVRISYGAPEGNMMGKEMLVMADPDDGAILQIIRTPQLSPINISCVRDGKYYAIHWAGENENMKAFLMVGTP